MALNVSAWSIRNPVPSVVMFIVLMALGWVSFNTLPITRFPNIDVPVIAVTVTQSGAAPGELETQVARKVEDAVAGIAGVKNIQTTLSDGTASIAVEFRLEVDTDRALNDVKDAVAKIRGDLPRTVDEPIVQRIEVENQSILTFSASSPGMTLEQLSWHVDDVVARELQGLKGVGRVDRIGGVTREIRVSLIPDRLMALGVTAADVNAAIKATTVDLAGGRGQVAGQEQSIRTLASAKSVEDLRATMINLSNGREIRLGEIATVTDSFEEPQSFSRLNAETPIVTFSIYRAKGASDTEVADRVRARIAELAKAHPDVTYNVVDDSVSYTYGNFENAMQVLIEGAVLAVIVVFIFLRDWRATIIAAVALPLSAIPTFWAMSMMGFSLNLVSLLAITLVTGILVDDAIVEIENIARHMKMGKSPYRASMEAADEIGLAVIAITMTIVAIFAPVSFMGGIAGQYFKQFGLVVAVAVLFSLLVARLITPMMAAYFLRPHKHEEPRDGIVMRAYTAFLAGTLWQLPVRLPVPFSRPKRKVTIRLSMAYVTVVAGFFVFVAPAFIAAQYLPQGFIPKEDIARIVIATELPPGASLGDTQRKTDEIVRSLREIPEVKQVFVIGGSSPTGAREYRKASIFVELTHKSERTRTQAQIEQEVSRRIAEVPDVRGWYINERGEREVNIALTSSDPVALAKAVADLEGAMRRTEGLSNVAASAGVDRPEVRIVPRLDEAARLGITTDAISQAIRVATIGDVGGNLAQFNAGDRQIPIRVQLDERARSDLATIANIAIVTPNGTSVPLSAVADISFGQGPATIERFNRVRRVTIGADLTGGLVIGQALEKIYALPEANNLPPGVKVATTGDAEIMEEVFNGFAMAMGAGLMMVFGVLILLLGSPFQPMTIMLSLPLSVGGVILALFLTNTAVSMPVVIGILMLMGIVTKNAIMLVDFAIEEVRQGVPRRIAIIDAGRKRARPIIMTTIAMVAGMVPVALGHGDGGEFRAPMAIAVIGGLLVSTILSLVFVPSLYSIMDDVTRLCVWIFGRFVGPKEEDPVLPGAAPHGAITHGTQGRLTPPPLQIAAE